MPTLDTLITDDGAIQAPQHVCVYGPPKVGKTQLIGQLAIAGYKLIWFDLENGKATLLKMPREALANITYIGIKDVKEEPIGHATMDKIVRGGNFNICDYHGRIECPLCRKDSKPFTAVTIPTEFTPDGPIIVMDSSTQLSMSTIHTVIKGKPADYQETIHDFRNQGNYLNRIYSYIQHAPFHFITTAHEIEAEREDGGIRIVPSIGSRNYAINCGKFFDHIIYLDKVNCKHKAASSTTYSNNILTGSRTDVAIEQMAVASLEDIFSGRKQPVESGQAAQAKASLSGTAGLASKLANRTKTG